MVSGHIYHPYIPLVILGISAVLIFIAARGLKISNSTMCVFTALIFLSAGSYVAFELQFLRAIKYT